MRDSKGYKFLSRVDQSGITLVEVLMAVILLVFIVIVINTLPSSFSSINRSNHTSIAREVAAKQIDNLRLLKYENLPYGTFSFSDSKLNPLSAISATYKVECYPVVNNCVDPNVETAKLVTVTLAWKESGDNKQVELITIVSSGGLAQ